MRTSGFARNRMQTKLCLSACRPKRRHLDLERKSMWPRQESNADEALLVCMPTEASAPGSGAKIYVASPGIEPGSGASETLILSIVLRGQKQRGSHPPVNCDRFALNILMAMASKITPKNLRITIIPLGPSIFSIHAKDRNTR